MNTAAHPLPNSGGSYVRNVDGSLTLEQLIDALVVAPPVAAAPAAEPIIAAKPAKSVKEV